MKCAYRVLAFVIAGMVAFQSAVIVFAIFGLFAWVEQGGVVDRRRATDGELHRGRRASCCTASAGQMLIPLLGLVLLIFSFFAKIPGGIKWALIVFGTIVVQVLLGIFGHGAPLLGLLHGLVALVLFGLAVTAGMRVKRADGDPGASGATSSACRATVVRQLPDQTTAPVPVAKRRAG